ncbi:hypothetical protein QUF61_17560 [Candidatus Venteria ishoeyi]|uniref:hypothetical protein n=1 Tax=Candidatus Venteria ishoeyi TaxID=1899563 RepID=UPI0025A60D8F|nr:hypothetical protein [Candidatus Venteria ishoeyi]MDM8548301.1 hypothetical protein [Candidatus Venteria ishoeyi]
MAINIPASAPSDFTELPAGTYPAVIRGVWDIGRHKSEWQGVVKINHQVIISYEFDEAIPDGKYEGDRYTVNTWVNLPPAYDERSKFIKIRNAVEGRVTVAEDYIDYDEQALVGRNVLVAVEHTPKGKPKIVTVSSPMKGMTPLSPVNESAMPEWVKTNFLDKAIVEETLAAPAQPATPTQPVQPSNDFPPTEAYTDDLPFG